MAVRRLRLWQAVPKPLTIFTFGTAANATATSLAPLSLPSRAAAYLKTSSATFLGA